MNNLLDLHTHSVLSGHAYSSLTENIAWAKSIGLKYYGISEHQPDSVGVGAHRYALLNLRTVPRKIDDLTILRGIELNILKNGNIECPDVALRSIDYAIASFHDYAFNPSKAEDYINGFVNCMKNDYVTIIGHIDRAHIDFDPEPVIIAAKEHHKLIELNNSSLVKNKPESCYDFDKKILPLCAKHNVPIIVNSDAHICYEIGKFDAAFKLIDDLNFPHELVVNYNEDLFKEYFKIK